MPKLKDGYADEIVVPAGKRDVLVFDNGHDDAVKGFGIRKYADGSASYIVKYVVKGQPRRHTLGPVRNNNCKKMRSLAEDVKARARIGEDIIGKKKDAAAAQQAVENAATIGALIKVFLAEREEMTRKIRNGKPVTPKLRARTYNQSARYLTLHFAALHGLVVGTVTNGTQAGVVSVDKRWAPINGHKLEVVARSHVVSVIDDVAKTRGKVTADRCKTALSTFFLWCIDQGYCDLNPTENIKARAGDTVRERTLSPQELVEVWHACSDDDYGKIVRLLMLTGQRKDEMGGLRWSEIDPDYRHYETDEHGEVQEHVTPLIMLPPPRCKTGRTMIKRRIPFHLVPLSEQALDIINSIPRGDRDLVFGRGAMGYAGWSYAKAMLDHRINLARAKAGLPDMPHWTLHDLRRSFTTHAKALKLGLPHEIEAALNHTVPGVGGKYDFADYLLQKRQALVRWGAHIARLMARPDPAINKRPRKAA